MARVSAILVAAPNGQSRALSTWLLITLPISRFFAPPSRSAM
ncbi:Uncharacterised protein [Vibrio cholerae]|nr:Uncharacterised protein [Vibrio cholerae]